MAFDVTQPTDNTKIRRIGTVIRPNFSAIQSGDTSFVPYSINLADRSNIGSISDDPTGTSSCYRIYCKHDASGSSQLWGIDPSSHIAQLTCSFTPSSSTNGYTFIAGGMMLQWGTSSVSNGSNTITFSKTFSATPYNVQVTSVRNSDNVDIVYIKSKSDIAYNQFKCYNTSASGIQDIYWLAIGPKV